VSFYSRLCNLDYHILHYTLWWVNQIKALSPKAAGPRTNCSCGEQEGKLRLNKNGFGLFFGKSVEMVLKWCVAVGIAWWACAVNRRNVEQRCLEASSYVLSTLTKRLAGYTAFMISFVSKGFPYKDCRLKSYLKVKVSFCIKSHHITFSTSLLFSTFNTAAFFLKAWYSLFVLKVPLSASQSINLEVSQKMTYEAVNSTWWHCTCRTSDV